MCEVFKVVNDIGPAYLKKYFTTKDSFCETWTDMPLVLPKLRLVRYGKRSFSYECALLRNNLENSFKLRASLQMSLDAKF